MTRNQALTEAEKARIAKAAAQQKRSITNFQHYAALKVAQELLGEADDSN